MDNNQNLNFEEENKKAPESTVAENISFEAETVAVAEEKPEPPVGQAIQAMVFGIISIELSMLPLFGIVGIIFAVLARKWAAPIIEEYPYTKARLFAKAGYITGGVGRGLFIGFTIFWALYFAIFALVMIGLLAG